MNSKVKKLRRNKKTINKSSNKRNLKMNKISRKKKQRGGDYQQSPRNYYKNLFKPFTFETLSTRSPTTTSPKEPISWKNYHKQLQANDNHLYKPKKKKGRRFNINAPWWSWGKIKQQLVNPKKHKNTMRRARNRDKELKMMRDQLEVYEGI